MQSVSKQFTDNSIHYSQRFRNLDRRHGNLTVKNRLKI